MKPAMGNLRLGEWSSLPLPHLPHPDLHPPPHLPLHHHLLRLPHHRNPHPPHLRHPPHPLPHQIDSPLLLPHQSPFHS